MKSGIVVFTDGASRGNPGPGGFAAVLVAKADGDSRVTEIGGHEDKTTNNKMELRAAVEALKFIETRSILGDIEMHTDSAYLANGATGWVYAWEKNGWRTREGEPVGNEDLWKDLSSIMFRLKISRRIAWIKVEGHAGLRGNERADELATLFADGKPVPLFSGRLIQYEKLIGGKVLSKESGKREAKMRKTSKAYSYVSKIGTMIMVHKTWPECLARVKGKSGALYKKSVSKEDESAIVASWTKK